MDRTCPIENTIQAIEKPLSSFLKMAAFSNIRKDSLKKTLTRSNASDIIKSIN